MMLNQIKQLRIIDNRAVGAAEGKVDDTERI